jgi:polyisoprenoid-binding protein YceI
LIATALLLAAAVTKPPAPTGRLVVFTQAGSIAATDFEANALPKVRALATARGITVDVRDVAAGAPAEVHVTPLIVYQDEQGRSIFKGRYADVDRLGQFLRTVKAGPLAGAPTPLQDMAVWRRGRAVLTAPIKITPLTGTQPPRYDEHAFMDRARRAVMAGFTRFRYERRVDASPSDRAFYMDFHPYRGADGKLFISAAIYSGFNCVEPVFTRFDEPVTGTWAAFDEAFRQAGRMLEDEVAQLVVSSTSGDAFDPVRETVPAPTWDAMGLALPPAVRAAGSRTAAHPQLGTKWTIESAAADDPPRLAFRFAPPLDSYNGEIKSVKGTVTLGSGATLAGASGTIEGVTTSITMGNKVLDNELRDKILRTTKFPSVTFTLDPLAGPASPPPFGSPVPFSGSGRLDLLGTTVPLAVSAQVEAVLADDGTPRLEVRATFRLRIKEPFGLEGPDGPSPANDTMLFDARIRLKPY